MDQRGAGGTTCSPRNSAAKQCACGTVSVDEGARSANQRLPAALATIFHLVQTVWRIAGGARGVHGLDFPALKVGGDFKPRSSVSSGQHAQTWWANLVLLIQHSTKASLS